MPTVSYSIVDTVDDASQTAALAVDVSGPAQAYAGGGAVVLYAGFRFRAIAVPAGATITSATLTLVVAPNFPPNGSSWGSLRGVASDNAPLWTATGPGTAPKTTESVAVTSGATGATVAHNVTSIVQAIVSRAGWAPGNALAFAGDVTGADGIILWVDYQDNPAQAATLSITYEEGGGTTVAANLSAGGAGSFTPRGSARRAANMASAGVGSASWSGVAIRAARLTSAGESNVSWSSSAVSGGAMSSAGSSSVAWSVYARSGGSLTANGSGAASWVSSADSAASLNVTGEGSFVAQSSSVSSASLDAEGVGSATLSGASISGATWIAPGVGSFVAYTGASAVVAADWTAEGLGSFSASSVTFAGGALTAAGAADMTFRAGVVAGGSLASSGVGSAAFSTSAVAAGDLSAVGSGAAEFVSSAVVGSNLNAAGSSSASFGSLVERSGSFVMDGVGSASWAGAAIVPSGTAPVRIVYVGVEFREVSPRNDNRIVYPKPDSRFVSVR